MDIKVALDLIQSFLLDLLDLLPGSRISPILWDVDNVSVSNVISYERNPNANPKYYLF